MSPAACARCSTPHRGRNWPCWGWRSNPISTISAKALLLAIAEALAADYGERMLVVEPHAAALPGVLADSGAALVGLEEAMAEAELVAVLVDHAAFRDAPPELARGKTIYDTRGMWA